jgi:adenosine/AMP kinase
METEGVPVEIPPECNVIIGQSHFIKTAEDLYEAMVNSTPSGKFGIAFCEASGPRLVRVEGNDEELKRVAAKNAMAIGAGHVFVVLLRNAFPVNVLGAIKAVPEVCSIFCATANELRVVVAKDDDGRGVIGVIDGKPPMGVENDANVKERREFLRKIGYKH